MSRNIDIVDVGDIEIKNLPSGEHMLKIKNLVPGREFFFVWSTEKLYSLKLDIDRALK